MRVCAVPRITTWSGPNLRPTVGLWRFQWHRSATDGATPKNFTQDVNAASMCGHNDWRMPTIENCMASLLLRVRHPT